MRAWSRSIVAAVFVVATAAFVAPVGAQPKRAGGGEAQATSALAQELNLAPAQQAAIRDIEDEAEKRQLELGAALDAVEVDLRRELDAEQPNDTRVAHYIDQVTGLEASMRKTQVLAWLKVRRLLSGSQRARLEELHQRGERARVRTPRPSRLPAPMVWSDEPSEGAGPSEGGEPGTPMTPEELDENGTPGSFVAIPATPATPPAPPTPVTPATPRSLRTPRAWQTAPMAPMAPVAPVPPAPRVAPTPRPDPAPVPYVTPAPYLPRARLAPPSPPAPPPPPADAPEAFDAPVAPEASELPEAPEAPHAPEAPDAP